jgi:hypothetical protein
MRLCLFIFILTFSLILFINLTVTINLILSGTVQTVSVNTPLCHSLTSASLHTCRLIFSELIGKFSQFLAQFKIFSIGSWFPKLMHPPSSSVRILQAKVTICQQKFVPFFIRRVHHVPFTSLTMSGLRTRSPCVARSLDTHVGLNVATRFLLPCLVSVQTVVLCLFWLQCSRSLRSLSEPRLASWATSTPNTHNQLYESFMLKSYIVPT